MKTLLEIQRYFTLTDFSLSIENECEMILTNLFLDSRDVTRQSCFLAVQGETVHGQSFINKAIAMGAALILTDQPYTHSHRNGMTTPIVVIPDLQNKLSAFASWFYSNPSSQLSVIGITGTNGKTSTAFFTAQLLQQLGQSVALMGTLGNGLYGQVLQKTLNTTVDVVSLNRLLALYVKKGAQWCIIEVSSHAIMLGRIQGITFSTLALTQVTRDHLDFHGSLEHYQSAKRQLFTHWSSEHVVLNMDDEQGQKLHKTLEPARTLSYSTQGHLADLAVNHLSWSRSGFSGELKVGSYNTYRFESQLIGAFNVENMLCAIAICVATGFDGEKTIQHVKSVKAVSGRMEVVQDAPTVIIDFAHTPDALSGVLASLKEHQKLNQQKGRLVVLFGCGGNRDVGKRVLMAQVAEQHADVVILTNDNPRFEDERAIVNAIMLGFSSAFKAGVRVQLDRRLAIEQTLNDATSNDIILIAGKGHEDYQDIQGKKHPFSDHKIVANWKKNIENRKELKLT